MRKPVRAEDWDCRQSCFTWLTFGFRIADVRKVGLSSELLTRKPMSKCKRKQPVDPGYIIDSTINTNSLLVTSLKLNAGVIKNSLGSLVVKHMVRGEGREEKRQ